MQYVPLTNHLNALAQLYQQCATLSEKCDKLAREEGGVISEEKQILLNKDQERIEIDFDQEVLQTQEENKSRNFHSRSNTPIEINIVDEIEDDIKNLQDNPISNQTKKIKRIQDSGQDKIQQIECLQCKQIFKNHKQMMKHIERIHNEKSVKKMNKKVLNEVMIQI